MQEGMLQFFIAFGFHLLKNASPVKSIRKLLSEMYVVKKCPCSKKA